MLCFAKGLLTAVQVFDCNGRFLRKFGTPAQFFGPRGIAVDSASNWIVCDADGHSVQFFAPDGSFVTSFGGHGSGPGRFGKPSAVCVDRTGRVLVCDEARGEVQVFGFEQQPWQRPIDPTRQWPDELVYNNKGVAITFKYSVNVVRPACELVVYL